MATLKYFRVAKIAFNQKFQWGPTNLDFRRLSVIVRLHFYYQRRKGESAPIPKRALALIRRSESVASVGRTRKKGGLLNQIIFLPIREELFVNCNLRRKGGLNTVKLDRPRLEGEQ